MMKQQPFVSKLRLSKLCRWILTLGCLKLGVFLFLALVPVSETPTPEERLAQASAPSNAGSFQEILKKTVGVRGNIAHAAESSPAVPVEATAAAPSDAAPRQAVQNAQAEAPKRPDEVVPGVMPAPKVSPFVPRDSAKRKQEELNRREQELLALQQQMETRLDELRTLEGKIQTMLKQAGTIQDDKLKHLIDVYTNMKAKQAAQVLATLDERIAVKILAGMRGKQAGEILTYMQAEPAAKLSELLSRTQLPEG